MLQVLVGAHDHERVDRLGLESTALLADVITDFREVVLRLGTGGRGRQDRPRNASQNGPASSL